MLTSIYTKAIKIEPSVIGYITQSVALVSNGERHKGYRACDIAFERFHSSHVTFLLLIKVGTFQLSPPQLLIALRLSSCLWPESTMMQSHT